MRPLSGLVSSYTATSTPSTNTELMNHLDPLGDPEANLIFRLAGAEMPLNEVGGDLDWHRVVKIASDENALLVLRDWLRSDADAEVPVEVKRLVAMLALNREYRMRLLEARLEESLAALNAAGIDVLLLKGGALAYTVYGSFVSRPMRDIDLLIRPERAEEGRDILLGMDWSSDTSLPDETSYRAHHHLAPLLDGRRSGLRLEIHRALLPVGHPFHFDYEELWGAARPVQVGAQRALVMHPTHQALHIAIHFAWSHMLKSGAWHAFRDFRSMIRAELVDWNEFGRTATEWRASSCCYWPLRLAAELSRVPVPDAVLSRLRPNHPDIIHRLLLRHFARGLLRMRGRCPSIGLERALWAIAIQPGRTGHGRMRPWAVSQELGVAMRQRESMTEPSQLLAPFRQIKRSGRYLSEILA